MQLRNNDTTFERIANTCDSDEIARILRVQSTHFTTYFVITVSLIAIFYKTKHIVCTIRRNYAKLTIIVVGAGPIGLTSALISLHCNRVRKLVVYEEQSRLNIERQSYQIAVQSSQVSMLRSYGVDFDNLEGLWHDGCFYTRVGIYLEFVLHVLPLFKTDVEINFGTKFTKDTRYIVDNMSGRKLVICCDGSTGIASKILGLSDETVTYSTGIFAAAAAIDRRNQTSVPIPEKRVHNLSFDLSAYGTSAYECNERTKFTLKLYGNSQCRHMALAVNRCDTSVVRTLKSVLDKSMMRNIFLKCYNTYKRSKETSISDSYCLNNMKFSPRLYEIKLSQKLETAAYITDCDLFIITEGEAARSYNFNTGLDINMGLKGLASLPQFIQSIVIADTEHSIVKSLVSKIEHSEGLSREFLTFGLKQHLFT
ncbi:uncharacterized protein LOC132741930 [Ruditapes philippinarum]|uniref:uncharacterized protein LOC132741930 n=1 Tax=Ruditapes philippinarum TaxID=129788 RepID=UPI00295B93B6|nr:uncharacterized protein LOC132741930 [Ruditapes philippinarum]XP_060586182.1 uncharacterized protein LOC132741930 [Ruditapes philippinarum]